MRTAFSISAVASATLIASSLAANCNPSYNVPGSGECYTNCNIKAGQKYVPGWTMDHTSELFLKSLAIMCNKSGPNYGMFMTTAGICMAGCKNDDPEQFNKEFAGACGWWNTHKNDTCDAKTTTTTKAATTTTTKAATTTTKADTTTTKADTTTTKGACQAGYRGKKNGKGPEGACCSKSSDCQESCIQGKCNAPIDSSCYTGSQGKKRGDGYNGACCKSSADCWESCVKGKCDGPSLSSCNTGYSGKKKSNGPKDACCASSKDCKNSCVKGKCN
ncbi:hypothetical protein BY458DRAFT_574888 [Sporodiniella umbellata]|nr:hypothetical protein BY458DRAFT_574888 [Sporodiniella umbellata]